jgi:nucleotide-binding universal stress UspA family protein
MFRPNSEKVVVPFDFSEASAAAVAVAESLAKSPDDVHVIHVIPHLPAGAPYAIWNDSCDENRVRDASAAVAEELVKVNATVAKIHVSIGRPSKEIDKYAHEVGAELIVIPSHGRKGIERFLLGSVTEQVVRQARCSVLVLKTKT